MSTQQELRERLCLVYRLHDAAVEVRKCAKGAEFTEWDGIVQACRAEEARITRGLGDTAGGAS